MPYVTLNIADKIEMNQFRTEAEAHKWCQKGYYPLFIIFEGTIEDAFDDKLEKPIAIYVNRKRFSVQPAQ
jgi:hypothetical protein